MESIVMKEQAGHRGLFGVFKHLYSMFPEVWIWVRLTQIWSRVRQKEKGV